MAKKFGGFTPQQQQTLLSKMGYTGPAQQDYLNKFMMSSPKASSMMGKYAQMAKARVSGRSTVGMAEGGPTEVNYYNPMAEAQAAQAPTVAPHRQPCVSWRCCWHGEDLLG